MSDQAKEIDSNPADTFRDARESRDWFLLEYVRLAEIGVEMGVTLSMNGTIVTGTVISGQKYFRLLAEDIRSTAIITPGNESVVESIASNYDFFHAQIAEVEKGSGEFPGAGRAYIHLFNAKLIFGKSMIPTKNGVLWRGKLAAVDAFFGGNVTID